MLYRGGTNKKNCSLYFFKDFLPHSRFFLFESKANRRRRLPFGDHISSKNLQSKRGWRRLLTSCTRSLIMPNFGVLFSGSIISGTVRPQRSGYFCMSLVCLLAESNVLQLSSFLHSGELYRNHQREKNVENYGNFTFWASWFSDLRIHRFLFVRSE